MDRSGVGVVAAQIGMLIGMVVVGGLAGCRPVAKSQGAQGISATYHGRTLTTVLPAEARVPAVIAAAEETVRARGYSVEKSTATEEIGTLIARPPRTGDFPELNLEARAVSGGTQINITVRPLGDQEMSRSILDGVLQRMGM